MSFSARLANHYALWIGRTCLGIILLNPHLLVAADPLASWNDSPSKNAIIEFVQRVTDPTGDGYVSPENRIVVFDNDGTLWCEQPIYPQLAFAVDRIKALAPEHPQWRATQPFQAVLENDWQTLGVMGEKGLLEIVAASHAGMSVDNFSYTVAHWLETSRHPKLNRPYTELVYQPMLELLDYLRAHQFKTYIVSGGGVEFMRVFSQAVYGIPPEQVIGSSIKTKFEIRGDQSALVRLPELDFVDDKAGKPVAIHKFIGKRPIAAFGNSDGDYEMLRSVSDSPLNSTTPTLCVIVHHTDSVREYAYDRDAKAGRLDRAWNEAAARNWHLIDMRRDWQSVFKKQ
jgi:phosphoglycolate phosphatase-like HAD superfamily hydrolase